MIYQWQSGKVNQALACKNSGNDFYFAKLGKLTVSLLALVFLVLAIYKNDLSKALSVPSNQTYQIAKH